MAIVKLENGRKTYTRNTYTFPWLSCLSAWRIRCCISVLLSYRNSVSHVSNFKIPVMHIANNSNQFFWDVTLWKVNQCLGGAYSIHLQGRNMQQTTKSTLLRAGLLFDLLCGPEDGGDKFLLNTRWLLPGYTASYLRTEISSFTLLQSL
jgi:hypothetical protein